MSLHSNQRLLHRVRPLILMDIFVLTRRTLGYAFYFRNGVGDIAHLF